MLEELEKSRRVSVPLVAISTPDQQATVDAIINSLDNDKDKNRPVIVWDLIRGAIGRGAVAQKWLNDTFNDGSSKKDEIARAVQMATTNPPNFLEALPNVPTQTLTIMLNVSRLIMGSDADVLGTIQAIANLRDVYKETMTQLIMLSPDFRMPTELANDVLVLDEPLPDVEKIQGLVRDLTEAAGLPVEEETVKKAAEAATGLSRFGAEQAIARSFSAQGINLDTLWDRKRQLIRSTPGLAVWSGGETFDQIGGNDNVKRYLRRIIAGPGSPNVVLFIDEGDKVFGIANDMDTSGVSQDYMRTMLAWMEDSETVGMILYGPAGAGKSAVAKATGNDAGIPTIQFDLGGMKGSLVGESERNLRSALRVVDAVGQKKVLVLMTCNQMVTFTPELKRRFRLGTFFFDLPSVEERAAIWKIYEKKYGFGPADHADLDDDGWTGAEIRQVCDTAYRINGTLHEAANYMVPISRSDAKKIQALREQADGVFLSANHDGTFSMNGQAAPVGNKSRQFNLG